ncbi:uncharacterized protein KY384_005750 [Bacidia gigantensis]|uniref:uncharacterized protein n=1 Tax=Bacidia gigantensis TaxID=2732470 RepID=UPI001D049305|nr:uncharacterized protein KY384_005750 [Bacidia gigantensis]KAG8529115.1 hypothetical protein KY384_005750 [Bacidia gigantensis]
MEKGPVDEKFPRDKEYDSSDSPVHDHDFEAQEPTKGKLNRDLKGRHMQMIAIDTLLIVLQAVQSALVSSSALVLLFTLVDPGVLYVMHFYAQQLNTETANQLIGFMIIGCMLLFTVQALGEMAVLIPVNGAFFAYACRFIDESWGFAMGWDYALSWLTILPFEITAAGITIKFWRDDINVGVWITVFLFALCTIQIFGVRGYGEVEFVLSLIKIVAVSGFIIFGIIVDCGGVPSDPRGYIGAHYWHDPGAFRNGFKGFCSVFVTAAFAFGGTELVGLAAAEAANPRKTLPTATKQVFWRITFFYVVSLFIVGLILPSDSKDLLGSSGANTKASPFVLAIQAAKVKGLPSVFNAVITISVLSVANSCTYGSTRTMQALATRGMGPKFLTKIDKHGRPYWCVVIQLCFGLLAFINEANVGDTFFTWLLSLSGLSYFFVWGSICLSHIRFRAGWKAQGHTLDELPYQAQFGIIGSYIGFFLNCIALIATFYVSLFPVGGSPDAQVFFESYLAAPIVIALYVFWKIWTKGKGGLFVKTSEMDVSTGIRQFDLDALEDATPRKKSIANLPLRTVRDCSKEAT